MFGGAGRSTAGSTKKETFAKISAKARQHASENHALFGRCVGRGSRVPGVRSWRATGAARLRAARRGRTVLGRLRKPRHQQACTSRDR
jgi:hypothetical protein